jgi:hypothetical protein
VALLSMGLFVTLFAFGDQYFRWSDPAGHVQLVLFGAFVLGMISGYKAKS